jgi:hypothetical protein
MIKNVKLIWMNISYSTWPLPQPYLIETIIVNPLDEKNHDTS